MVEGIKSVHEVLKSNLKVEYVLVSERIVDAFEGHDVDIVDQRTLDSLSTLSTNETCIAVVHMPLQQDKFVPAGDKITLVLDGINDPGNLGTIIRTLDWFGYDQVLCSEDSVDFYNPKTIAASMGSFTRVTPYYVNLKSFIESANLPVYGMEMNGQSIQSTLFKVPSLVIMGSESHGIREYLTSSITQSITIPGSAGRAESLNVGIAASMLLYELSRN